MPEGPSELTTKRLHISGLTAAISSRDLERRLATFGTLTALDGFGKLDALGQPCGFAYVTLQTTKSQLSRCMCRDLAAESHPTPLINRLYFRYECAQRVDVERSKTTYRRSKACFPRAVSPGYCSSGANAVLIFTLRMRAHV